LSELAIAPPASSSFTSRESWAGSIAANTVATTVGGPGTKPPDASIDPVASMNRTRLSKTAMRLKPRGESRSTPPVAMSGQPDQPIGLNRVLVTFGDDVHGGDRARDRDVAPEREVVRRQQHHAVHEQRRVGLQRGRVEPARCDLQDSAGHLASRRDVRDDLR